MEHLLFEIGLVVIAAGIVAVLGFYFKQPLILAYIIAGILIGPFGFGLIHDAEFIHGVASIGVMLMLFLVGLEMNLARLKDLGKVALVAGIGQVVFTGLIGFLIIKLFGFTMIQSAYLAVALTFSSTVIAVKLMSDKKDIHSFYGQICIGILIVQDILAIIALLLLAGFKEGSFAFDYMHFGEILIKGVILGALTMLLSHKVLKHLYNKIALSHELLILFSLTWCFLISLASLYIGFSMEIGAFIAGVSLASMPYTFEINAKAKVLRDFFITIFFAGLGTGMIFSDVGPFLLPLIALSLFVLIGNPIIVMVIMGLMGYDKRTSFFTGLTIANISEFSLIVAALGNKIGHLDEAVMSMIAIIAITTMVLSSYLITYNTHLYRFLKKYLTIFEFRQQKIQKEKVNFSNHIILIGCGQTGEQILEQILSFKDSYLVIDHDKRVISKLMSKNINCMFGDAEDEDLLEEVDIENAEIIISTLPNHEDNYFLLQRIKEIQGEKSPIVIACSNSGQEGLDMFARGVDYVILKPYLSAHHVKSINKEIYKLEEEIEGIPVITSDHVSKHVEDKIQNDHEMAKILHNLNKLRLKEIKAKIEKSQSKIIQEHPLKMEISKDIFILDGNLHLSNIKKLRNFILKNVKKSKKRVVKLNLKNVLHIDHQVIHYFIDMIQEIVKLKKRITVLNLHENAFFSKVDKELFEKSIKHQK